MNEYNALLFKSTYFLSWHTSWCWQWIWCLQGFPGETTQRLSWHNSPWKQSLTLWQSKSRKEIPSKLDQCATWREQEKRKTFRRISLRKMCYLGLSFWKKMYYFYRGELESDIWIWLDNLNQLSNFGQYRHHHGYTIGKRNHYNPHLGYIFYYAFFSGHYWTFSISSGLICCPHHHFLLSGGDQQLSFLYCPEWRPIVAFVWRI